MATVRLVIVLLMLGTVALLAVQNTALALPLIFFGGQTVTLPLGVWLVLAIGLGALTTLVLTALLGAGGGRNGRSKAYKYRPQPFYEPVESSPAARDAAADVSSGQAAGRARPSQTDSRRREDRSPQSSSSGGTWQDWTNLQSANQWNDWEAVGQGAQGNQPQGAATAGGGVGSWFFGNRKAIDQDQVNQSWQELSEDWDGLDNQRYRARGVSPVDDHLEDINQGWENTPGYTQPSRDYEVPQSPKRVYRDGSIYSYSYRNQDNAGQRDNIYAPADDVVYGDREFDRDAYIDLSGSDDYGEPSDAAPGPENYGTGGYEGEALGEPEIAEDGVVDADYRVIIPPAPAAEEPAAGPTSTAGEGTWEGEDEDDWNEAEDALTP